MATVDGKVWSVYVLRCADDSLYTGIAVDVSRRVRQHECGPGGAKYLKGRGPLSLVFQHPVGDRALASRIEYRIKQMPKADKECFVSSPSDLRRFIESIVHARPA